MANHNHPMVIKAYRAEVAITKYMVVIQGTAEDQCNDPGAANDVVLGVALNAADAGEIVDVCLFGLTTCIAQTAVTSGQLVAIQGTTGKVAPITIGVTTADQRVVGKAFSTVTTDGDYVTVFVGLNDYVAV
jgi:hypothetical protein